MPFCVQLRQVGTLADRAAIGRQRIQRTLAPEDHAVLVQEGVVFLPRDAAAARGDHAAGALAQLRQHLGLHCAERRLARAGEEFRDLTAETLDDLRVRVEKRPVQALGKQLSHRGLAAAGHSDQNDVLHLDLKFT